MAAVAPAPPMALDVVMASSPSLPPATDADHAHSPSRLVVRLPTDSNAGPRRNPIKHKWRSFVNFFTLPIRSYYLEPPGNAYRAAQRARRGRLWDEGDDGMLYSFWPVPAYTDQVGDDEMVLFKAQEEVEAIAAAHAESLRRERETDEASAQQEQQQESPQLSDDDELEEQLVSPSPVPLTLPELTHAEPSPRYELQDPLSAAGAASAPTRPARNPNRRTRTTSNLAPTPSFANGTPMSRHVSTPLNPTSSSPPTGSSLFGRRLRANSTANGAAPTLGGRTISEPLSWTLVRSQYSYPKSGLTPQQLSFLSSVESLGRFGIPHTPRAGEQPEASAMPSPMYMPTEANDYGFPSVPGASQP